MTMVIDHISVVSDSLLYLKKYLNLDRGKWKRLLFMICLSNKKIILYMTSMIFVIRINKLASYYA